MGHFRGMICTYASHPVKRAFTTANAPPVERRRTDGLFWRMISIFHTALRKPHSEFGRYSPPLQGLSYDWSTSTSTLAKAIFVFTWQTKLCGIDCKDIIIIVDLIFIHRYEYLRASGIHLLLFKFMPFIESLALGMLYNTKKSMQIMRSLQRRRIEPPVSPKHVICYDSSQTCQFCKRWDRHDLVLKTHIEPYKQRGMDCTLTLKFVADIINVTLFTILAQNIRLVMTSMEFGPGLKKMVMVAGKCICL
jgi:hypothetical protein